MEIKEGLTGRSADNFDPHSYSADFLQPMQVQTTLYQNSGWLQRSFFFVKLSGETHTLNLELNKLRCYVSAAHGRKITICLVKSSNFIPYPTRDTLKTFVPRFH